MPEGRCRHRYNRRFEEVELKLTELIFSAAFYTFQAPAGTKSGAAGIHQHGRKTGHIRFGGFLTKRKGPGKLLPGLSFP